MLRTSTVYREIATLAIKNNTSVTSLEIENGYKLFKTEVKNKLSATEHTSKINNEVKEKVILQLWEQLPRALKKKYCIAATHNKLLKNAFVKLPNRKYTEDVHAQRMKQLKQSESLSIISPHNVPSNEERGNQGEYSNSKLAVNKHISGHTNTNLLMQNKSEEKLSSRLNKDCESQKKRLCATCKDKETFNTFYFPNMKYFSSFTEMQRSIAPTRRDGYVAVCLALAPQSQNIIAAQDLSAQFDNLTPYEQNLFRPIAEDEAVKFELFCAHHAAGMNSEKFNILWIFVQYRKIVENLSGASNDVQHLFKSLLQVDRVHDGLYFKVRRNLERLWQCRSSDCGWYISNYQHRKENAVKPISPSMYGLCKGVDEVAVSTALAETRVNQSVYDDVLERASMLRPQNSVHALALYNVKQQVEPQLQECKFKWASTYASPTSVDKKAIMLKLQTEQKKYIEELKEQQRQVQPQKEQQQQQQQQQQTRLERYQEIRTEGHRREENQNDMEALFDNELELPMEVIIENGNNATYMKSGNNQNFDDDNEENVSTLDVDGNWKLYLENLNVESDKATQSSQDAAQGQSSESDQRLITRRAMNNKLLTKKYKASKKMLHHAKSYRARRLTSTQKSKVLPFQSTVKPKSSISVLNKSSLIASPQKLSLQRRDRFRERESREQRRRMIRGNNYTAIMEHEANMDKLDEQKLVTSRLDKFNNSTDDKMLSLTSDKARKTASRTSKENAQKHQMYSSHTSNIKKQITTIPTLKLKGKRNIIVSTNNNVNERNKSNNQKELSRNIIIKNNNNNNSNSSNNKIIHKIGEIIMEKANDAKANMIATHTEAEEHNSLPRNKVNVSALDWMDNIASDQNHVGKKKSTFKMQSDEAKEKKFNKVTLNKTITRSNYMASERENIANQHQRDVKYNNRVKHYPITKRQEIHERAKLSQKHHNESSFVNERNANKVVTQSESMQRLRKALQLAKSDAPLLIQPERYATQRSKQAEKLNFVSKPQQHNGKHNKSLLSGNDLSLFAKPELSLTSTQEAFTDQLRAQLAALM